MGTLPSSRLTKLLQEKAESLKKRRARADQLLKEVDAEVRGLAQLNIELDEIGEREGQIKELARKGEWEVVEEKAKGFLDYVAAGAAGQLEERRRAIDGRAEHLGRALGALPDELAKLIQAEVPGDSTGPTPGEIDRLASLDRAVRSAENGYARELERRARAVADWSGEANGGTDGGELAKRIGEALEPASAGNLEVASRSLTDLIRSSFPSARARREVARSAGEALVAAANDLSLPCSPLETALRADSDASPLDWPETVVKIEVNNAQVAEGLRERVVAAIESLRGTLESLRDLGIDPSLNLAQLETARGEVAAASAGELPKVLTRAREATEEPVVQVVAGLLDEVRPRLVEARRLGRDASDVFAAMNRAREALRLKIYSEALAAAQEANERVGQLIGDLESGRAEADSLTQLVERLERVGFATQPYRQALDRANAELTQMDVEAARRQIQEAIRGVGRDAYAHFAAELGTLEKVAEQAKELGFVPSETAAELALARTRLEEGQLAESGEILAQAKVRLRAAAAPYVARRVEELNKSFEEIQEVELVSPLRRLLADADVGLRVKEDLAGSLSSLRRAEREFSAVVAAHASSLVESLEDERRALEAMGGAGDEIQRQIDEVQQIFNMGDFVKASRASQEIRTRAHQQQLVNSEEAISHAKLALVELGKMGLDTVDLKGQLDSAVDAAKGQRYADAYRLAGATQEAATRLRNSAQGVLDYLSEAVSRLNELKQSGHDVTGYRSELEAARAAYRALNLDEARTTTARVVDALVRDRSASEARQFVAECDQLVEDAQRLGVPTESFYPRLAQVKELLSAGKSVAARSTVEPLRGELIVHLRPVLEENLRAVERDLEVARSAGLKAPDVVELLGEARRRVGETVPTGAAERIEGARAQLIETKGFLEHAERALSRAREALNRAELVRVDVGTARGRMERLEVHLAQREYSRVIELSGVLERELSQSTHDQVAKTLAGFQGMLVRLGGEGIDTALAGDLLGKARAALEEGRPLDALQLATRSEAELERSELQLRIAQASLETAEGKLGGASSHGIKVPAAEGELRLAREAFQRRRFPEVLERVVASADLITAARDLHRKARDALDSADRQVKEAMELGADVGSVLSTLEGARGHADVGAYAESTREARLAAEAARESVDRLFHGVVGEVRGLLDVARSEGAEAAALDAIARPLGAAEAAIKTREWKHAGESLNEGREAAYRALDAHLGQRLAELEILYHDDAPVPVDERSIRDGVRARVAENAARHAYALAFAGLREESGRATARWREALVRRLGELESRVWVGEKLGVDTTPAMELFSEAKMAVESSKLSGVPDLISKADRQLGTLLTHRLTERQRDVQTELVFAQEGLHVATGPVAEMLAEVERRRVDGAVVEAGRALLTAEEELNRRKAAHRELMNLHYLIDAAIAKAVEKHLDVSQPRQLLDESIRARAADYAPALAKAREALGLLHAMLKDQGPEPSPSIWPFRRPPTKT